MLYKFSKLLSYVFHPLIIPTFALIILFNTGNYLSYISFDIQKSIYLIVFISTFVLPLSFMPFFLYSKAISSIFMKHQKERIIPLLITVIFYFFAFYILQNLNAPKVIRLFMLGAASSVLFAFMISFFWKISTHMMGIGGLLAIIVIISTRLMVDTQYLFIIFILISGLIGMARLYLQAHTSSQIYAGITLGFITVFIPFLMY